MTLPFRRRHNDAEASHDRARSLIATGFLEPVEPADATWLETHLAGCAECRGDAEAYETDRELLRSLRDQAPEPPRDLWARTAAEIERSHGQRGRGAQTARSNRPLRLGRVPLGVMSGVLVVLVVIGAALAPRGGIPVPGRTDTGRASGVAATPISVDADALAWIQLSPDGSYELYQASVNEVCVDPRDGCALLNTRTTTRLQLKEAPQSVLFSQDRSQIVVVTKSTARSGADIVVVSVPTVGPSPSPTTTSPETSKPSASTVTASASPLSTPKVTPSSSPSDTASGPPLPTGSVPPSEGHAIATGVIVIGDAAYSADGTWLAFSARPADQTTGPDLYTWHVGDEKANAVTADHRTFFAGWLGNRIIANRVGPALVPDSLDPNASGDPSTVPATPTPPPAAPTAGPTGSADPDASPVVVEEHPVAFILDPTTSEKTPLGGSDMWHPTVDPIGKSVVYWAGTLVPDGTGTGWKLGTGHLVFDGWLDGEPTASADPSAKPGKPGKTPAAASATPVAGGSVAPTALTLGPAGHPVTLSEEPVSEFDASFDRTGTRLAVWISNSADATVGTLRLVVLDPDTHQIDASSDPLPGVAALRGISIRPGRLAWVTPPGQDGQGSHVQVLAWNGREFGQVRTVQGDGFFVAR